GRRLQYDRTFGKGIRNLRTREVYWELGREIECKSHGLLHGKGRGHQMFGKAKAGAPEKHEQLPPAAQLLQETTSAVSDSMEISSIGLGMTIVGKISSERALHVLGRVEGELHASIVRISNGAQVEGTIATQELTISGHFMGTIQADRVLLTSSAV